MINIYDDLGKRTDRAVWYLTPSHGYLKVLVSGVMYSGFKPSKFSYQNLNHYFLEEDQDAIEYLKALHGDQWQQHQRKIPERICNKEIEDILQILKHESKRQLLNGDLFYIIDHQDKLDGFNYNSGAYHD